MTEQNTNSGNGAYSLLMSEPGLDSFSFAQEDPLHKAGVRSFEIRQESLTLESNVKVEINAMHA